MSYKSKKKSPKRIFWDYDGNTLLLNGAISEESWAGDEITPELFSEELDKHTGDITVWINSPGGDVFAASQIYEMLKDHDGEITVKINLAASAASIVAMAGDKILISKTGMMMIHNPTTEAYGDKAEMQKASEMLDEVKEGIINAYMEKTHLSREEVAELMDKETWMSADKAIELGFADGYIGDEGEKKKPDEEEETEENSNGENEGNKTSEENEEKSEEAGGSGEDGTPGKEEEKKKDIKNCAKYKVVSKENKMKRNIFEAKSENTRISDEKKKEFVNAVFADAKSIGSFKKALVKNAATYGMENVDILFPDAQPVRSEPDFIKRDTTWVDTVLSETSHSPFARVKSITADVTADEARAKGYIKGNKKEDEFFTLAKRVTNPTTLYKKQALDRDDMIDITDMNTINFLYSEMRLMLNEELARAILIGDGRQASATDKINEQNIRPVYNDADLYTVKVATTAKDYSTLVEEIARSKPKYKGSGNPTFYTTSAVHASLLWGAKDTTGRRLYESDEVLASALGVSKIVDVPVMEGLKDSTSANVLGVMVNLADYTIGTDRGGEITTFEDFDIDYNQYKYLLETRCSGALTRPYSALTFTSTTLDGSIIKTA